MHLVIPAHGLVANLLVLAHFTACSPCMFFPPILSDPSVSFSFSFLVAKKSLCGI